MPHDLPSPAISSDCADCDGHCCKYVAVQLDRPRAKRDYDHIRWFLMHANVAVYIDRYRRWFVEFQTPCRELQPDNKCGRYAERPDICRLHNTGDDVCERHEPEPYQVCFTDARQFEAWLDQRQINWRFKHHDKGSGKLKAES